MRRRWGVAARRHGQMTRALSPATLRLSRAGLRAALAGFAAGMCWIAATAHAAAPRGFIVELKDAPPALRRSARDGAACRPRRWVGGTARTVAARGQADRSRWRQGASARPRRTCVGLRPFVVAQRERGRACEAARVARGRLGRAERPRTAAAKHHAERSVLPGHRGPVVAAARGRHRCAQIDARLRGVPGIAAGVDVEQRQSVGAGGRARHRRHRASRIAGPLAAGRRHGQRPGDGQRWRRPRQRSHRPGRLGRRVGARAGCVLHLRVARQLVARHDRRRHARREHRQPRGRGRGQLGRAHRARARGRQMRRRSGRHRRRHALGRRAVGARWPTRLAAAQPEPGARAQSELRRPQAVQPRLPKCDRRTARHWAWWWWPQQATDRAW